MGSASLPRNLSKRPLWVSLSPLFADSPDVVVPRESAHTSTKRPELSSALSSRTLSVTQSPTPNTPSARPSTLSSVKAAPFTASADDRYHLFRIDHFCVN